jgi:hypothetical protein
MEVGAPLTQQEIYRLSVTSGALNLDHLMIYGHQLMNANFEITSF